MMHVGEILVEMPCFLSERLNTGKGILRILLWQIHVPKVSFLSHKRTGKFKPFGLHVSKHILKKIAKPMETQKVVMSEI